MVSTRFSSLGQVPQSQVFDSQILHSQALHSADAPDTHASDALDNTHTPGPRAMPRMQSTFASLRGVRPLAAALMAAVLLPACTTLPSQQIPEAMLTPEAVQETSRIDPAGEPYYLNYQVGTIGLTAAFDDGSHTYAEFEQPVPSDLACFDDAGALLGCEAVGNVLAVEGVHKGILLRHGENALFIAPNPKAQAAPPRQLGNTPAWAAHVQARNRVILKAPLRQALERSAGVVADPALNQAAGLRTSMGQPAAAPAPTSATPVPPGCPATTVRHVPTETSAAPCSGNGARRAHGPRRNGIWHGHIKHGHIKHDPIQQNLIRQNLIQRNHNQHSHAQHGHVRHDHLRESHFRHSPAWHDHARHRHACYHHRRAHTKARHGEYPRNPHQQRMDAAALWPAQRPARRASPADDAARAAGQPCRCSPDRSAGPSRQ